MTKIISKKNTFKKAKWLSEEALRIAEKKRKAKVKREREGYAQLNAEFQTIARRNKKAFLSEQHKEIEGKKCPFKIERERLEISSRKLDTKGTFHAKMGMIKGKNGKDLDEAEEIKRRWQEYPEELYKKGLNDLDNHHGVVTHLEPDILEREISGL